MRAIHCSCGVRYSRSGENGDPSVESKLYIIVSRNKINNVSAETVSKRVSAEPTYQKFHLCLLQTSSDAYPVLSPVGAGDIALQGVMLTAYPI